MSIKLINIVLFYFLSIISTLGYGFFFKKIFSDKKIDLDYGYCGLIGIFFLTIYSYLSHFFIKHGLVHNTIVFFIGISLFLFLLRTNYKKNELIALCIIFSIILLSFFGFKTHDDFPYYHFPYTNYLTTSEIIIGVGNYDPSWRYPSSIFYFNSLFYLPVIKYFLYHIGALLIMGFSIVTLCLKLLEKYNFKKYDQLFFYNLLSLSFILVFFYRLAEHGTDRSAQILSFILISEILIFFKKEQKFNTFSTKIFAIGSLAISLKVLYLVYLILLVPIIHFIYKEKKLAYFKIITNNPFFYFSIIFFTLIVTINFLNSGCLLYPITFTCFEDFSWSASLKDVLRMKIHYENWSKAGATPIFRVDNVEEYISNLNWLSGWLDRYFFNKMSDYLLGLILLSLIFYSLFYSKKKNYQKKVNLKLLYFSLVFLFLEWFYNHPSLRYGGYYIIAILIFIPLSNILSNFKKTEKNFINRVIIILVITISIFSYRNIDRIIKENKIYKYSPVFDVYYYIDEDHHFRVEREFTKIKKFYNDCTKLNIICENENKLIAKKKYGRFIFIRPEKFKIEE